MAPLAPQKDIQHTDMRKIHDRGDNLLFSGNHLWKASLIISSTNNLQPRTARPVLRHVLRTGRLLATT